MSKGRQNPTETKTKVDATLLHPTEQRFRKTLLWVGVSTAFLIIMVGWVSTRPWQVQASEKAPAEQPVPQFLKSLKELQGLIESSMQSISSPL